MPRNMSFAMTKDQVKNKTKTVTRRIGWWNLKNGEVLQPVEKGMGLKKGEKVTRINGPIRVISARKEPLDAVTDEDVVREGFPEMDRYDFILFFMEGHKCLQGTYTTVMRIEFEYV